MTRRSRALSVVVPAVVAALLAGGSTAAVAEPQADPEPGPTPTLTLEEAQQLEDSADMEQGTIDSAPSSVSGQSTDGSAPQQVRRQVAANETVPVVGPVFNLSLPKYATQAEISSAVSKKQMPVAPAHGGAFETMTNAVRLGKPVDVMLFGDSMVQQGVDPQTLELLLTERYGKSLGRDVTVFNAASSRARWGINRMLVKSLVKSKRLPKVALIGITTRAAENDLWYRTDVQRSPFSSYYEGCARPASSWWTSSLKKACQRNVRDHKFRFRKGGGQYLWFREGRPLQQSIVVGRASYLRDDGFMIHPGVTAAESDRVSKERIARGFPGYPTNHSEATGQWREMISILRKHGVRVISFEVPYPVAHQDNLEATWPGYDARRQKAAKRLAGSMYVAHYPVKRFGSWWGDGDSRDAIHLAPQGADNFARQLGEMPNFLNSVSKGLSTSPRY